MDVLSAHTGIDISQFFNRWINSEETCTAPGKARQFFKNISRIPTNRNLSDGSFLSIAKHDLIKATVNQTDTHGGFKSQKGLCSYANIAMGCLWERERFCIWEGENGISENKTFDRSGKVGPLGLDLLLSQLHALDIVELSVSGIERCDGKQLFSNVSSSLCY